MRSALYSIAVVAALSPLAGCSFNSLTGLVDPYRIDVRQGNYVDQDMVAQLRKGMTRDQVRFVLGTPLVVDAFRDNRWDYVYLYVPGEGESQSRKLSVFFEDDRLMRVEGDVEPETLAGPGEVRNRVRVIEVPPVDKK